MGRLESTVYGLGSSSSISAIEGREESGDERDVRPLLEGENVNRGGKIQSRPASRPALGVVAELESGWKRSSKVESFSLVELEPCKLDELELCTLCSLCFVVLAGERIVLARRKFCFRPEELADDIPVKKENGLLNLYGTLGSLHDRALGCAF